MGSAVACARAAAVKVSRLLVDGNVVTVAELGVVGVLDESNGIGAVQTAQTGEVEHLHAVVRAVGDDEHKVSVDLRVAPRHESRELRRHEAEHLRVHRVGDVNER